ncbi:MAG TPA: hypothetical protein VKZ53_02595 [Candidatus Angelobacter sp.]|nr:hypothetical protein [Candidatus Angelobacter sp.]
MKKLMLFTLLLLMGCGGGNGGSTSANSSSATNIQGKWQVIATSSVTAGAGTIAETNLTQTGSAISSSNVAFLSFTPSEIVFTGLNACGGPNSTLTAKVNGNSLSFTLTEGGSSGTRVTTGTETIAAGGQSFTGSYSSTGCGVTDSGTLNGTLIGTLTGTFTGLLNGASVSVTPQEDQSHNLTVSGTSSIDGSFTLTGTAEGGAFLVSGPISGTQFAFAGFQITQPFLDALKVPSVCFTSGPCVGLNGLAVYEVDTATVIGELNRN